MSTTHVIFIIAIVVVALIAVLAARSGGPRVTHIETRREKDGGDDA